MTRKIFAFVSMVALAACKDSGRAAEQRAEAEEQARAARSEAFRAAQAASAEATVGATKSEEARLAALAPLEREAEMRRTCSRPFGCDRALALRIEQAAATPAETDKLRALGEKLEEHANVATRTALAATVGEWLQVRHHAAITVKADGSTLIVQSALCLTRGLLSDLAESGQIDKARAAGFRHVRCEAHSETWEETVGGF